MNKKDTMKTVSTGGISFCEALTLIFVVLKLLGKIDWPWIVVLSPTLIPITIVLVIVLILMILRSK